MKPHKLTRCICGPKFGLGEERSTGGHTIYKRVVENVSIGFPVPVHKKELTSREERCIARDLGLRNASELREAVDCHLPKEVCQERLVTHARAVGITGKGPRR